MTVNLRALAGTFTASGQTVGPLDVTDAGGVFITVHGTYNNIALNFEVSDDGATWYGTPATSSANAITGATTPSANATSAYLCSVTGASYFRVRSSSFTSGTMVVNLTAVGQMSEPVVMVANAPTVGSRSTATSATAFWSAAAVGAAGTSTTVNIGQFAALTVHVNTSAATNVTAQVSPDAATWYNLNNDAGTPWQMTLAGAGNFAQPLPRGWACGSSIAGLRLVSSAAATITAGYMAAALA